MKRAWFLLLFPLFIASRLNAESLAVSQFGGLNTDDNPLTLQGQTPDSENVTTDDGPGVKGRTGFIAFSTEPASDMWEFPLSNGTRYMIRAYLTDGKLKATTGDGTFSVLVSTIPTDRKTVAAVLGDKFYFANTLDGLKYWDTSVVTVASAALTVDKLVTHKGRLWVGGKSGSTRVIYGSKYLDGTTWATPTNPSDDDPTQITIAGALDENLQALYSSFQDKLVWLKTHSFGAIIGSRRSNFNQRTFSDSIGTGTPDSVRDCADKLRWLGPDRKIWEFDGSTYYKITEDIDVLMATVGQGDSNSRTNTQTSQGDWQAGSQSPSSFLDLTTTPGDQTPATTTLSDDTQANFQAGSCSFAESCNTTLSSGSISATISTPTITTAADFGSGSFDNTIYVDTETVSGNLQTLYPDVFTSLRDGTSGTKSVWTTAVTGTTTANLISVSNGQLLLHGSNTSATQDIYMRTVNKTHNLSGGATFYFDAVSIDHIAGDSDVSFYFIVNDSSGDAFGAYDLTSARDTGNRFYFIINSTNSSTATNFRVANFEMHDSGFNVVRSQTSNMFASGSIPIRLWVNSGTFALYANDVLISSGSHTFSIAKQWYMYMGIFTQTSTDVGMHLDNFTINPQTFTFTGPAMNTGLTTGVLNWGNLAVSTSGAGTITYQTQSSSDGSSYDAAVAATAGAAIASSRKQYIRALAAFNFGTTTYTSGPLAISDLTTVAYDTMSFTSRTLDSTYAPPVWGLFTISTTAVGAGGTTSWQTQASADGVSWDAAVAVTPNTKPTSTQRRYFRYVISSTPAASGGYDRIDTVSLAVKSTGTFTSQTIDFGPNVSSYGPMNVTDSVVLASSITYQFSSSSTIAGVGTTWTTVAKGGTPTSTVARYGAVRAIYYLSVATQTPTISDIQVSWTEGSTIRTASAFFNNRYWLSVAISSTTNNRILVYDKKKQWQRYSGVNADAMTLYNSKLYFANTSGIWQAESGYSDNSASITSYYRTPTLAPTKLDVESLYDSLYMTTDTSDSTLTSSFQINGIPTDYSLASVQMNSTTGFQNFKLPFGSGEVQVGKYINFKWQVIGTSSWRITNGTLYYQPMVLPE